MANRVPLFFFAPIWDYPPGGPPPPADAVLFQQKRGGLSTPRRSWRLGKFSILKTFLNVLGFDVDVGVEIDHNDEEIYHFDLIGTTEFAPKPEYLQNCVEADDIHQYLQRIRYRKPLYIITGLKVVTGARANALRSQAVGVGLGMEGKVGSKGKMTWEGTSDFIFAFRVRKILEGCLLEEENEELNLPELSISREKDHNAEDEGFKKEQLIEDDNLVACAVLRRKVPVDSE
ncbi:hypothetical protein B0J13DRAFT_595448 [Dactylonectria estremocensis]|uniref:Uncharacterized protein n=1 Tax=Dactylonectria estremocensis TaxID=1079267 RepID=A0A9P9J3E7_9HYPO|nr:hypothetical protein B0J13DRAFT_595448 [Dactylonectria estremocensis]